MSEDKYGEVNAPQNASEPRSAAYCGCGERWRFHPAWGEGSIYFVNSEQRHRVTITIDGESVSRSRKQHRQAVDVFKELLELKRGDAGAPTKELVSQAAVTWFEAKRSAVSAGTAERYEIALRTRILPALGHHRLCDLRYVHIERFQSDLREALAAARSRNLVRAVLTSWLRREENRGAVSPRVRKAIKREHPDERDYVVLSSEQARALVTELMKDRPLGLALVLARVTGMRIGEVLALHWTDVSFRRLELRVGRTVIHTTKDGLRVQDRTKEGRTPVSPKRLPLIPELVPLLEAHRQSQLVSNVRPCSAADGLVFVAARGGIVHETVVRNVFKKAVRAAALVDEDGQPIDMVVHELRHTANTIFKAEEQPESVRRELLGHSERSRAHDGYEHDNEDTYAVVRRRVSGVFGAVLSEAGPRASGGSGSSTTEAA